MLACPICSEPLNAVDNGVVCPAGHRFDRARQGYLNLLPVQHKNSRDPGDNHGEWSSPTAHREAETAKAHRG